MFKKIFFHFFNLHRPKYLLGALSVILLDGIDMAPPIIVKKISERQFIAARLNGMGISLGSKIADELATLLIQ